ncbi:hypothetical protein ACFOVU_09815 [Nocardiopsis sediminis]|uniref:Uncharacterized protein n=1 Tax=Nocardiopsis sediminis TaxID=1778267 RepID=A0ABV8FNE4_9ACTN
MSVIAAAAAVFGVYLIGDSGSRAVWQDQTQAAALPGNADDETVSAYTAG